MQTLSENKAARKLKFLKSNITSKIWSHNPNYTLKKIFRNISVISANLQPPNLKLHNRNDANIQTIGWSNAKYWSLIMSWFSFQFSNSKVQWKDFLFEYISVIIRALCCKVSFSRPTYLIRFWTKLLGLFRLGYVTALSQTDQSGWLDSSLRKLGIFRKLVWLWLIFSRSPEGSPNMDITKENPSFIGQRNNFWKLEKSA